MRFNPYLHHRRSIRLRGYDYAQPGAYFITICTRNREPILGKITHGRMLPNILGEAVWQEWFLSGEIRSEIRLDSFVVMPNHVHGIVIIDRDHIVGAHGHAPLHGTLGKPTGRPKGSLGSFVIGFKSSSTQRINLLRDSLGEPVWQRNYYERIIRNGKELNQIREYIFKNPRNWNEDPENTVHLPWRHSLF